jgi:hypothetical protein
MRRKPRQTLVVKRWGANTTASIYLAPSMNPDTSFIEDDNLLLLIKRLRSLRGIAQICLTLVYLWRGVQGYPHAHAPLKPTKFEFSSTTGISHYYFNECTALCDLMTFESNGQCDQSIWI